MGKAKASVGSHGAHRALVATIEEELAPLLVGEDPRDIARLWEVMYNGSRAGHAFVARPGVSRAGTAGHHRLCHQAASTWRCGTSWAARSTRPCTVCWVGNVAIVCRPMRRVAGRTKRESADSSWGYVERGGFRAVKMRVGVMDGDVMTFRPAAFRAARESLGEEIDLMADAHGTFGVAEAKRFLPRGDRLPTGVAGRTGFLQTTNGAVPRCGAATDIPISAGESEFTRFRLPGLGAARRRRTSSSPTWRSAAALPRGMRIAALAEAYQLRLAPHLWGGALMFSAGLQVCAASPAAFIVEYSLGHNPLQPRTGRRSHDRGRRLDHDPGRPRLGRQH